MNFIEKIISVPVKALQYLGNRFGELSTLIGIALIIGVFLFPVSAFVWVLVVSLAALILFPDVNIKNWLIEHLS
jgi:hypothetical protein